MRSSQQADEAVIKLVDGRVLHRFLLDLHLVADRTKQVDLSQFQAKGCQTGTAGKRLRRFRGTLDHDDGLLSLISLPSIAMPHLPHFGKSLVIARSLPL